MMRPINTLDLLPSRTAVRDLSGVRDLILRSRVLITGGGGSIGSELARQVTNMGAKTLVLVDNNELALYSVGNRLPLAECVFGDVRSYPRMIDIMVRYEPTLVFHAAAMKHVPIAEANPLEAIMTNIGGTANVMEAATECRVKHAVVISTDKAVDPECVMGATKRVAERVARDFDATVVRFGNVLGSSGSVVPLFEEQIARGGPVTVTSLEATRYFMSVPEAVELVLQASTQTPGTYVLDMGEPVNIGQLAREMIRLAGKMPDDEIKIQVTGLRPGERLEERLTGAREMAMPSCVPGISVVRKGGEWPPVNASGICHFAAQGDQEIALKMLWEAARG